MATSGLVLVNKPAGWTSHDVVSRIRRLAGTKRVGHAGTLDPMATGVLVVGVERATKLLGHLSLDGKEYFATIRLGQSTVTDDADGEVVSETSATFVTENAIRQELAALTGDISQVPSAVSAIKVNGRKSYAEVRAGRDVQLAARDVTVSTLDLLNFRPVESDLIDVDVQVRCSSGTYIRAIARDVGAALGVGGHLTKLHRSRVGPYSIDQCYSLDELAELPDPVTVSLDDAVLTHFARRDVDAEQARLVSHGGRLVALGQSDSYGVFGPDGAVIALMSERDGATKSLVVFRPGN